MWYNVAMQSSPLVGINFPVLRGEYNHDLAPNELFPEWGCAFRPLWAYRYLALSATLGFRAFRLWLCENGEGLSLDRRSRVVGVRPELIEAIRVIQDGARLLGLKVYWTLLDGNSWRRNGDEVTGAIASERGEARRFAEVAAAPIAEALDPAVTFALEVLNEPESLSAEVVGDEGNSWTTLVASIREIRSLLHEVIPGVPITSGSQAIFLPGLLGDIGEGHESDAPVDAVDLHVYHPDGGLPKRADLPVDIGGLPLWAGECGLSHRGDRGCSDYLIHYLYNARSLEYQAVFLWKLEGADLLVQRKQIPGAPENTEGFIQTKLGEQVQDLLLNAWC